MPVRVPFAVSRGGAAHPWPGEKGLAVVPVGVPVIAVFTAAVTVTTEEEGLIPAIATAVAVILIAVTAEAEILTLTPTPAGT